MATPADPPAATKTSGWAVAALASGLLLFSILAIIFCHVAMSDIKKSNGRLTGKTMAGIGGFLGYTELFLLIGAVVFFAAGHRIP